MSSEPYFAVYDDIRGFTAFGDDDVRRLVALAPVFQKHGPGITDRFYESLGQWPRTAALVEGRVDRLKQTHVRWIGSLFEGEYGRPFFETQFRIGQVHVAQKIAPEFVEAVMNHLRQEGLGAILAERSDRAVAQAEYGSLLKVLDLCLVVINLAYADERLDRMASVTGMSRALIENLIARGGKKK
jgi:hypothetical protein